MRKHLERRLSRTSSAGDHPPVPPPLPPHPPTTGAYLDSGHQQRSRRKSWSDIFGGRRDKSARQTRKVVPETTTPSSSVTSPSVAGFTHSFPTSSSIPPPNSRWSPASSSSSIDFYHPHHALPTKEEIRGIPPSSSSRKRLIQVKPLLALTVHLLDTYTQRNANFRYDPSRNPRRVLTKPSVGCKNHNYDNENNDYIIYVNDILGEESRSGRRYIVQEMLGSGTFGQVIKCQLMGTSKVVGIKVIKNKPAYLKQSLIEVDILKHLNTVWDPHNNKHILRLLDTFTHKNHLCLVFELLSVNLYELLKQNKFRGLSTNLIRTFSAQIVDVLVVLNDAGVIHCDLKPENILLENLGAPDIKVIDFGSACLKSQRMYTYIQSRFYRSPEVLLGMRYSTAIDMWSFGCIVAELFLGLPLFPGSSEYNQISRIVDTVGLPPVYMIEQGRHAYRYFKRIERHGKVHYELKSIKEYTEEQNTQEKPSKKYFSTTDLTELILTHPTPCKHMTESEKEKEMHLRNMMLDFLKKALQIDPFQRLTPREAKRHPFIAGSDETAVESTVTAMSHAHINNERTAVDTPTCKARDSDDLANCCICSVSTGASATSRRPPHMDSQSGVLAEAPAHDTGGGEAIATAATTTQQQHQPSQSKPNNSKIVTSTSMIGTPPLSPAGMKPHEVSVSGLSTATDMAQQANSDHEHASVVPAPVNTSRSECQLRRRSQATQI